MGQINQDGTFEHSTIAQYQQRSEHIFGAGYAKLFAIGES